MSETLSVPTSSPPAIQRRRSLLNAAWVLVLLLTVPQIILGSFLHQNIAWLSPARLVLLAATFSLSYVWPLIRPLRSLVLVFLVIYGVEEGFFLGLVQHSTAFETLFGGNSNLSFFGERLMRIGASLVMLLVLLGMGLKRQDFFLALGKLKAVAEPEKWGVPRRPETFQLSMIVA